MTRSRFRSRVLEFYDDSTFEVSDFLAPVKFYDDFTGAGAAVIPAAGSAESGVHWTSKIVGAAPPTVAAVANQASGVVACTLTNASQKQDAALYPGDVLNWSLEQGLVWQARIQLKVLPSAAEVIAVAGLSIAWADGPDAIGKSVWFQATGSGELYAGCDDATTDTNVTTGTTLTTADWAYLMIDASEVSNIKFFINGNRVCSSSTFAYAATGANAIMQPFFSMYKASGTGVGTLYVDSVRLRQNRS